MVKPAIVIAYDGSDLAQEAVRRAAELFPGSPAVVVTVWEPGLAAVTTMSAGFDMTGPFPGRFDPALVMDVDRAVEDRAAVIAEAGASLGRSLGLEAEAHAIADELKVGETVADLADQRSAAAIVVGSRGISGLRSHLLGSTSRDILARTGRPVVVVRGNRNP
jgi:nucleotide-binding universal stress UspA family protein